MFSKMKYFPHAIIAIVMVIVAIGFFFVGSPKEERLRRFDERRVQDLQSLQWQIVNYWQRKERLPETLAALEDNISGFRVPRDPATGSEYSYHVQGPLTFSLCATFDRTSEGAVLGREKYAVPVPTEPTAIAPPSPRQENWNWSYTSGETCFERTIDPELYPPTKEKGKSGKAD